MTALAVVVALDPEGQIALQLLRSDQLLAIVIEVQLQLLLRRSLQLEGGEQALRNSVIPTAALGGHAAADLVLLQQDPVVGGPVLAALIRVDEQELRLQQTVIEGAVESLNHQGGIHAVIELPADDTTTEQVDPVC